MVNRKLLLLNFLKPVVELEEKLDKLNQISDESLLSLNIQIQEIKKSLISLKQDIFNSLTPLQRLHLVNEKP